ncbi:MAG: GNAT family N-acetyltransferase [Dehalococcoidia bacterium]
MPAGSTAADLPRRITLGTTALTLRPMTSGDGEAMLAFARSLPPHDLLFLRRDITNADVVDQWLDDLDDGVTTVLATAGDRIHGYATVDRSLRMSWTAHLAELRVLVSPDFRGQGLGRLLTDEAFRTALDMGVEKMIAQMTLDQQGAIEMFRRMGFEAEALLKDHVKDRDGKKYDLVMMTHDVAGFAARATALGLGSALEE